MLLRPSLAFLLLFIASVSVSSSLGAQSTSVEKVGLKSYELQLRVTNQKTNEGSLYAQLFDANGEVIENVIQPMKDQSEQEISFKNLREGKYAIRVFHDQNGNGKLDTNLFGIPKERFGFSNNVMGKLGPPAFETQLFELNGNNQITILLVGR